MKNTASPGSLKTSRWHRHKSRRRTTAIPDGSRQDYSAGGSLIFDPGQATKTINVSIMNDTLDEEDKNFFVNLGAPINATLSDGQAEGTTTDDDAGYAFENLDPSAVFQATLSAASGKTVSVNYATTSGTATAGQDYTAATAA